MTAARMQQGRQASFRDMPGVTVTLPVLQKERGFFGSITHALFGSNDGEEVDAKARDAANRTRASARSAADDVSDKVTSFRKC